MKEIIILAVIMLLLLLVGCASQVTTIQPEAPSAPDKPISTVKAAWEEQWEQLVREAKKEGRMNLYSGEGSSVIEPLIKAFHEKYAIKVDAISARSPELGAKIHAERRAGLYLMDVYIGGASTALNALKPVGTFDPLEPVFIMPETLNPKTWWGENVPWVDKDRTLFALRNSPNPIVVINTRLVKPEEIRSLRDVLNPKWKGKIIVDDPTVGGGGFSFAFMLETMDVDFLRDLAKQEPYIFRDPRLEAEWLAQGKSAIVLNLKSEAVAEFKKAGAPLLEVLTQEGAYITSGAANLALANRALHPNAARLFINWIVTKETQTIFSLADGTQSARVDVPSAHVDSTFRRQPGVKYFNTNDEEFLLGVEKRNKLAREIFGHLMK